MASKIVEALKKAGNKVLTDVVYADDLAESNLRLTPTRRALKAVRMGVITGVSSGVSTGDAVVGVTTGVATAEIVFLAEPLIARRALRIHEQKKSKK